MRLSIMSLAGIVRTLVAVGTVRLRSMFAARLLATPFSTETVFSGSAAGSPLAAVVTGGVAGASAGIGAGFAWMDVVRATGCEPVCGEVVCGGLACGAGLPGGASSTSSAGAAVLTLGVGRVIVAVGVGSVTTC